MFGILAVTLSVIADFWFTVGDATSNISKKCCSDMCIKRPHVADQESDTHHNGSSRPDTPLDKASTDGNMTARRPMSPHGSSRPDTPLDKASTDANMAARHDKAALESSRPMSPPPGSPRQIGKTALEGSRSVSPYHQDKVSVEGMTEMYLDIAPLKCSKVPSLLDVAPLEGIMAPIYVKADNMHQDRSQIIKTMMLTSQAQKKTRSKFEEIKRYGMTLSKGLRLRKQLDLKRLRKEIDALIEKENKFTEYHDDKQQKLKKTRSKLQWKLAFEKGRQETDRRKHIAEEQKANKLAEEMNKISKDVRATQVNIYQSKDLMQKHGEYSVSLKRLLAGLIILFYCIMFYFLLF